MSIERNRMNHLTTIRRIFLIAGVALFLFSLALIFSERWTNVINLTNVIALTKRLQTDAQKVAHR